MKPEKKIILADRDGTLIVEKDYLSDPEGVELIGGVGEAISTLNKAGWQVICVSNQSGVGRGYFTEGAVVQVNQRVQELLEPFGAQILEFYFCPDTSGMGSTHRKPAPGMALDAAAAFGFAPQSAIVVGDKSCDIELGQNIHAKTVLVRTGYGSLTEQEQGLRPDFVIDSFADLPAILLEPGENHAKLGTGR